MIRINLLPEEYRRKARTPFKMMLAISGAVALNGSLGAYWCWLALGVSAELATERGVAQVEMDGLTPQVAYHDALEAEIGAYASREKTLAEVTKNRVLWTKKLDELIDVVHSGSDGVHHYIWFDNLTIKQEAVGASRRAAAAYGSLKANGHSGSPKWNQVANFLEDVEDVELSHFILDFSKPDPPEATQNPADEDLIPSVNWSFPLAVELRSPEERGIAKALEEANK